MYEFPMTAITVRQTQVDTHIHLHFHLHTHTHKHIHWGIREEWTDGETVRNVSEVADMLRFLVLTSLAALGKMFSDLLLHPCDYLWHQLFFCFV